MEKQPERSWCLKNWGKAALQNLRMALMVIALAMLTGDAHAIVGSAVVAFKAQTQEQRKLATLRPAFREQVVEMLELARASWPDRRIVITEAYRPQRRQDALYKQGRHVTAVRKSKHTEGLAVDVYFVTTIGGLIIPYEGAPYDELGVIGESVGMRWGGRWKQPFDPGHFEARS